MTTYELHEAAPAVTDHPTRPFYWSVRREIWENRSIYLAPLIVMAVVMFALLVSHVGLPKRMRTLSSVEPARQHLVVVKPFAMAPAPIMFVTFIVGFFYALDALYGERRDRSILFWKSLPVSDRTAVLSKAFIPFAVLPFIALALGLLAFFALLFSGTIWLVLNGISPARLWAEVHFVQMPIVMAYGLAAHTLWFAPIVAWLLLLSASVRRAPFLWAILPPVVIAVVEKILFNTTYFRSWLRYRLLGAMDRAFSVDAGKSLVDRVGQLSPGEFLSTPALWIGLAFAALFLAAAVQQRRKREPI